MGIFGHKFDDLKKDLQGEVLQERNVEDIEGLGKIGCYENESRNNKGDSAYFKIKTDHGEARIRFNAPEYIIHKGSTELTKKERDKLVDSLKKTDKKTGKTLWDKLNDEYETMTKEKSEFRDKMPDYSKLSVGRPKGKK